ncbi:hypothetical protein [Desulfitobacterium sp.]|uniref:hypothetical protein n=1 Tax=Desulfitobacterium sp. TaxID=49981 RepID=UPI002B7082CB|nr:hypothetical protein [Desulfitobacterium sp.]HVJ49286.1 hypothetical protein [Desulfitobacterium sp.]
MRVELYGPSFCLHKIIDIIRKILAASNESIVSCNPTRLLMAAEVSSRSSPAMRVVEADPEATH